MHNYFQPFLDWLPNSTLSSWSSRIDDVINQGLSSKRYGDLPQWQQYLQNLPEVAASQIELKNEVRIGADNDVDAATRQHIKTQLEGLVPWRKGPLWIHDIHIDTEWRSDWKWDRVLPHLDDLNKRLVLDVGCGNGYHCLRMLGEGATRVIGIDPSPRFVVQFYMIKHFLGNLAVDVLPATLDDFPEATPVFDTVFSMGVLYHRYSPIDHLRQLKSMLRPGGQLLLETLVIEGDENSVLVPSDRYAMMNNVWFIPSPEHLLVWLRKCGFKDAKLVDLNRTTTAEQRSTEWMKFQSLPNFLDPNNSSLTVEGHPAPLRACFTAYA